MEINYYLSLEIDENMKMLGKNRQISFRDPNFNIFTKKEIENITELKLRNTSTIDDLKYLTNLKKLSIEGIDYNRIKDENNLEFNPLMNHIKNFDIINQLKNLETLVINNDINIKKLDISNLTNLKILHLKNDPELRTLKGLEKLKQLKEVIIYGTNIKNKIDFKNYVVNTTQTKTNLLDIKIILNNLEYLRQINNLKRKGLTRINFVEKNGFVEYTKVDSKDLESMLISLNKLTYKLKYQKDIVKIIKTFKYIVNEYKFSKEELIERQSVYNKIIIKYNRIPDEFKKYFASLHSSINMFYTKKGNCEGHVNLMSIILNMLDIENETVHCKDIRLNNYCGDTNHAMIRVKLDGKWLYCDPTMDKKNCSNYLLKTTQELENTHELSGYEKRKTGGKTNDNIRCVRF
ncbi:MAG: hypothetical protein RR623_04510 [Bacilli bacterium]